MQIEFMGWLIMMLFDLVGAQLSSPRSREQLRAFRQIGLNIQLVMQLIFSIFTLFYLLPAEELECCVRLMFGTLEVLGNPSDANNRTSAFASTPPSSTPSQFHAPTSQQVPVAGAECAIARYALLLVLQCSMIVMLYAFLWASHICVAAFFLAFIRRFGWQKISDYLYSARLYH